jgi:serine/threonine protein kinase
MTFTRSAMQEKIHGYEIEATLQERGNSRVLLLRQAGDKNEFFVMKTLPLKCATNQPSIQKQFIDEVICLRKMRHPNIISVLQEYRDPVAFSLPYIEGAPLSNLIDGGLSKEEIITITTALIDAIEHIHTVGLLHCDLKPENILIQENAQPMIIDFGLARRNDSVYSSVIGSSTYMPPEVKEGEKWSVSGELYALGLIFYEMAENCLQEDVLTKEKQVMQKCIEKSQTDRFQSFTQLKEAWKERDKPTEVPTQRRPKRIAKKSTFLNKVVIVLALIVLALAIQLLI